MISGIRQGRGKSYQPARKPRLIILSETLVIQDITKAESNNLLYIDLKKITTNTGRRKETELILLLEIMHFLSNLPITPYYRKLTLHEIKVLEINATLINANLMANDLRIKKINAKEEVEFHNKGN